MRVWIACVVMVLALPAYCWDLDPHLEPLRPFLGKVWRGEFSDSTPEKPVVDVSQWQPALQGKAVRITHSLNQGQYEGETLMVWDAQAESIVFYYFTTAGFYTQGKAYSEDGVFYFHEKVAGSGDGIAEVKSEVRLVDGQMLQQAYYLKQGEWVQGHSAVYQAVH
ncbi:hypothetical protein [Ferrimonas kyonanensis]|uniref:hypothetical protein n=1 Tax=Ferrimonas kyonanensis TaxID=364763 RepID=UPI00041E3776|nr:hypothetical protein [Ferrimonas kyonanensis]